MPLPLIHLKALLLIAAGKVAVHVVKHIFFKKKQDDEQEEGQAVTAKNAYFWKMFFDFLLKISTLALLLLFFLAIFYIARSNG